jgi:hypothetical protein
MGGRPDAVNVDADAAAVVSIIDHREYLGDTIEAIGAERRYIPRRQARDFRRRVLPKASLRRWRIGAPPADRRIDYVERADGWDYVGFGSRRRELCRRWLAQASSGMPRSPSRFSKRRSRNSSYPMRP